MEDFRIPEREIGENEEDLLENLWQGIRVPAEGRGRSAEEGFRELQGRLRRRSGRRLWGRVATAGAAAVVALALGVTGWQGREGEHGAWAEGWQGVERETARQAVTLTGSGGWSRTMEGRARMETQGAEEAGVRLASGERLALAADATLRVDVPAGQRFRLTLGDGTEVWLNAESSLEYPASFQGKGERRVRVSGEAYFEVQRDTAHPFTVDFGAGESVRVLGTSFNIRAYEGDARHTTTLVEGGIRYSVEGQGEGIILRPNEQVNLECATGEREVKQVDAGDYGTWREGIIRFEEERLPELAVRLERLYGVRIEVDKRLEGCSFTGKIRQERGIGHILELLEKTTGVRHEMKEGVIHLK